MSSIISDLFSLFFMIIIGYFTYITFFKKELTPAEKREIAKLRRQGERDSRTERNCKSKRRQ